MAVFVITFGALLLGFLLIFTLKEKRTEVIRCERCDELAGSPSSMGQSSYLGDFDMTLCRSCSKELQARIERSVEAEIAAFCPARPGGRLHSP